MKRLTPPPQGPRCQARNIPATAAATKQYTPRRHRINRRVGGTSTALMPPTRYVDADSREAQASLGATSSSASPRWIWPVETGVTAPSFFLFVTTTGVMVA